MGCLKTTKLGLQKLTPSNNTIPKRIKQKKLLNILLKLLINIETLEQQIK